MATFNEVKNMLDTLPISYYCGDGSIEVELSDHSKYSAGENKIYLDFNEIQRKLNCATDMDFESVCRTALYHELSHIMLTPSILYNQFPDMHKTRMPAEIGNKYDRDWAFSVVEDERIESMTNGYYMNTNFNKLLMAENGITNLSELKSPQNGNELFYQVVRFKQGPQNLVDRMDGLLARYSRDLDGSSTSANLYLREIQELYNECIDSANKQQSSSQPQGGQNQGEQSQGNQPQGDESQDDEQDGQPQRGDEQPQEDKYDAGCTQLDELKGQGSDPGTLKKAFKKLFYKPYKNSALINRLDNIFLEIMKRKRINSNGIHGYCGRIDPRATQREDFRYFERSLTGGDASGHSKMKLNLWIDTSGSFSDNEKKVNELLYALKEVENKNPNFSFDLISIGCGMDLVNNKDKRYISCSGGSDLDYERVENLNRLLKSLTRRDSVMVNILLVDGHFYGYHKFKFLDLANCTVICPKADEDMFYNFENAKVKTIQYRSDFSEQLIEETISALKRFFR